MALVDGFLELERSSGKLEWSAILQKMASDLGFSKILFGLLPKDSQDYENAFIVGNYPAAWREHYDRAGYARVDPTVSHCTQSVLPIFWEPSIYQTRKQHEFFEEASAAGLVYGLTMPLHGARGELGALSLRAWKRKTGPRPTVSWSRSCRPCGCSRTTHCRAVPDWPSNIRSANRWF